MFQRALPALVIGLLYMAADVMAQLNLDDLTGGCDPTVEPHHQCGGHGSCHNITRTCTCDDWWSQRADFIDSQDCPTSIIAMYVLWGLNVAEILWVLYSTSYVLLARAENFFEQKKLKRDYTLWKNKGLIAVLIYFTVGMPSHLIMAILHLVDPVTRVAFEVFPSVMFVLGKAGLYLSSIFLQGPLIATVLRGRPNQQHLVQNNYLLNIAVSFASIIIGCFAFITLEHFPSNLPKQIEIMRAYYLCQAAALLLNGLQALVIRNMILNVLDKAAVVVSSGDKTEHLKRKVNDLQGQIIKQGIIQGAIYIVMGTVPFLLNKHAYFLPISWLAMPIIGKRLAFQFDLDKAGAKTIAARLGLKKSSAFDQSATTGSKRKKEGDGSYSENPSFSPTQMASQNGSTRALKLGKKRAGQVLSVAAITDEEGAMIEIMQDEKLRDKFTEFVRSHYATEALDLYDACVRYQSIAAAGTSKEELANIGREIIDTYVREGSPKEVDMSAELRRSVIALQDPEDFNVESFDRVKKMAFNLLKSNFYNHFAKNVLTSDVT